MWLDDDEMPELVTQHTEEELDEMPALVEVHSTHWMQPMDTFRYPTKLLHDNWGYLHQLLHDNWGYLHRREVERTLMLALGIKGLVKLCVCYLV